MFRPHLDTLGDVIEKGCEPFRARQEGGMIAVNMVRVSSVASHPFLRSSRQDLIVGADDLGTRNSLPSRRVCARGLH